MCTCKVKKTEPCDILAAVNAIWNWQQPGEEKLLISKQKTLSFTQQIFFV